MTISSISFLIVVPTLNSYTSIPALVNSLLSQTFENWHLCFVDGPSSLDHVNYLNSLVYQNHRISCCKQADITTGIFGAMNQVFDQAEPSDWIIFWGSDDWAASPHVLLHLATELNELNYYPDLLVCSGRYVSKSTGELRRSAYFHRAGELTASVFRRSLFLGSTPPHQSTVFGPGGRQYLSQYASGYTLSADLDYFLRISLFEQLRVYCLDLELVQMSDGGVSGQQTFRRLHEVMIAYRRAFGFLWWVPFLFRYLRRISSLLSSS